MSGTIHLILEDKTDAQVVEALLKTHQISVRVRSLTPSGGSGGISRLAKDIERLIQTARNERKSGDCIAVLHDADEMVQPERKHYKAIAHICHRYKDVVEVIARDEIEAWLLADAGLCHWLNKKPGNCDSMTQPSLELNSLVNKKIGRNYSGSDRVRVLQHLNGQNHSPSLREALTHLENAPCVTRSGE